MPENVDARRTLGGILLETGEHSDGLKELRTACGVIVFNSTTGFSVKQN